MVEIVDRKEAVDKLNGGDKPNLVITDLNMSSMDGIFLLKAIRSMAPHKFTPILMLTTESSDDKKKDGQGVGATSWVVKPFNPEQKLATI